MNQIKSNARQIKSNAREISSAIILLFGALLFQNRDIFFILLFQNAMTHMWQSL